MLIYNPTFWIGIILTIIFHTMNNFIFVIGIFPYFMIASTSLFFRADWPSRTLHYILKKTNYINEEYNPVADTATKLSGYVPPRNRKKLTFRQKIELVMIIIFMLYWILMPLRFLVMPGEGSQS